MVNLPDHGKPQFRTASGGTDGLLADQPASRALDHAHAMIRRPDGVISFWASSLERLYGFTSADAVGRVSHALLKAEFPRPLKDIEAELCDTGEWSGLLLHCRRDGQMITVASHWALWQESSDSTLICEVNNQILGRDQAHLASIVDGSDDAIIGKTLDGIITSWNKAAEKMFGYAADEICGKSITVLFPPDRLCEEQEILERIRRGERVDHFESVRRRKDNREVIVSLTISPIRDRHGRIVGVSKIARDITEQRAAQNRLVELQSELLHASRLSTMGQMAAAITHELNQPLSAINNYLAGLDRLLPAADRPAKVADGLCKAREQTTRAGEIVRRLRELAVKGETSRRVEDINDILEKTLGLALVDAKLRGVRTSISLAPDLDPVLVDKIQIGQVILNIVRNAIEAMDEVARRELAISTATDGSLGAVEVRIADSGPGLPPGVKARLFEPFVTTKAQGMGLGLSICRDIIDSHGGSLSAGPNQAGGTIFLIRLPTAEAAEAA